MATTSAMRGRLATPAALALERRLQALGTPEDAAVLQRFFKTGPGEYGEGDRFLGIRVPVLRGLVRELDEVSVDDAEALLHSAWHEARLLALLLLVRRYRTGDEASRARIYRLYLDHTARINNWDLVDLSAEHIVGAHLHARDRQPLERLSRSSSLWERRIAVLATFHFIRKGEVAPTLVLAERLLTDPHDLMHKAVGWMLREADKREPATVRAFVAAHAPRMPRTMLRYAIERYPEPLRRRTLALPRAPETSR